MARKRQLSDAFGQFGKEAEVKTAELPEETDKNVENVDELNRYEIEQDNAINKRNTEHVTKGVIQNESALSVAQVKSDLLNMYEEKTKKE